VLDRLKLALVSCGFLGCSPIVPGTVGTLGGVLFAWLLRDQAHYWAWCLALAFVLYLLTRGLGEWAENYKGKQDPGIFVQDEVIGYLITIAWFDGPTPLALLVAFFVFRILDIAKPPPCRWLEKVGKANTGFWRSGDGILLDDVMAGLYGLLIMVLLRTYTLTPADWSLGG
jgi:phosphatidylglycerophosphatase A